MSTDRRLSSLLRREAESNYSSTCAEAYRESDEVGKDSITHSGKCEIIRQLSERFSAPVRVLDLGCGTGRYFHCVPNVGSIVGVDPSEHMLQYARQPVMGGNPNVRLVRSTLQEVAFARHSFDLVMCVGVLGSWCAPDPALLRRVADMLTPMGIFFFTAIEYQPLELTWKGRVARAVRPLLLGSLRRHVDARLKEFRLPEDEVRALSSAYFSDVAITRWQSPTTRIDLHCVLAKPKTPSGVKPPSSTGRASH